MASLPVFREDDPNEPLDEMDPCCMKEIINARHHERVGAQLRPHDRSQIRLDERLRAIKSLRTGGSFARCECCASPTDYPLLAKYRKAVEGAATIPSYRGDYQDVVEQDPVRAARVGAGLGEYNSEDDEDWDSADEAMLAGVEKEVGHTAEETERIQAAADAALALSSALNLGFGEHSEDSAKHVSTCVREYGESLVLHVYQPELPLCAWLDLALEKLAKRYLGTRFRRVKATSEARFVLSKLCVSSAGSVPKGKGAGALTDDSIDTASIANDSTGSALRFASSLERAMADQYPVLLCFSKGEVVAMETQLQCFGNKNEIYESDLTTYLNHAHVLYTNIEDSMTVKDLEGFFQRVSVKNEDEDEVEPNRWCGQVGCTTGYFHEHIGKGQSSLVKDEKNEALDEED
jgi:hypothetical protein